MYFITHQSVASTSYTPTWYAFTNRIKNFGDSKEL